MAAGWRPARLDEVSAIARLSNGLHNLLPEREEVFEEKIRLSPAGCLVLEAGGRTVGYVLSHPWKRHCPPPLDSFLGSLPADADCWYIHDIGVDAGVGGTGVATRAVDRVLTTAAREGFRVVALVAVSGAAGFWRRFGFRAATTDALGIKLREYGADAVYMELPLSAGRACGSGYA